MGVADAADPGVVAIASGGVVECTGTLIAPRVVLTAAHCVVVVPEQVFVGESVSAGGTWIDVTDAVMEPRFDRGTFDHDIAVVLLASDASPAPVPVLAPASDGGAPALVGAEVRVVGFGATDATGAGAAQRRSGTSHVATVSDISFDIDGVPSQPCSGDSGGPTFLVVGGREVVAGVHSSGPPSCTGGSRETRVDAHADFLAPYVVHAGGCSVAAGHADWLGWYAGLALLWARRRKRQ